MCRLVLQILTLFQTEKCHFFRVPPGLCIETRLSAQPLIWKWFFILMQIKLIFTRKVVLSVSLWKLGFLELGSGLLKRWIHSVPYSRPKWANSIPFFRPKRRQNPTLWGGTHIYGLYKKEHPPGLQLDCRQRAPLSGQPKEASRVKKCKSDHKKCIPSDLYLPSAVFKTQMLLNWCWANS